MPIAPNVVLDEDVVIFHRDLVNLYGCRVGAGTKIGAFVEIQKNAAIGQRCKVSSHSSSARASPSRTTCSWGTG